MSRDIQSTCKFGLGVQNEAGKRLTEFSQENTLVIANTLCQQHKRHGHHQMVNTKLWLYSLQSKFEKLCTKQKQDLELTVAQIMSSFLLKIRLKLKKVEKTTKLFKSELNQIPYEYTQEVMNRLKGFECLKDNGWRFETLYRRWWPKPSLIKRSARWQNGCQRSLYK